MFSTLTSMIQAYQVYSEETHCPWLDSIRQGVYYKAPILGEKNEGTEGQKRPGSWANEEGRGKGENTLEEKSWAELGYA